MYGKAAFGCKKKKLLDAKYVHTVSGNYYLYFSLINYYYFFLVIEVNGTACAIPRTIMALLETHQKEVISIKIMYYLIISLFLGWLICIT